MGARIDTTTRLCDTRGAAESKGAGLNRVDIRELASGRECDVRAAAHERERERERARGLFLASPRDDAVRDYSGARRDEMRRDGEVAGEELSLRLLVSFFFFFFFSDRRRLLLLLLLGWISWKQY